MKNIKLTIYLCLVVAFTISANVTAQQTKIDYNSDTGASGPHLLIEETGDPGNKSGEDGWARMWFKNSADAANRWGFLARPQFLAVDNPDSLMSPLIMAYTGVQRFGFGRDGTLRINKKYSLPNVDGFPGDILTTDGLGNVSWQSSCCAQAVAGTPNGEKFNPSHNGKTYDIKEVLRNQQSRIENYESQIQIVKSENAELKSQLAAILERLDAQGK